MGLYEFQRRLEGYLIKYSKFIYQIKLYGENVEIPSRLGAKELTYFVFDNVGSLGGVWCQTDSTTLGVVKYSSLRAVGPIYEERVWARWENISEWSARETLSVKLYVYWEKWRPSKSLLRENMFLFVSVIDADLQSTFSNFFSSQYERDLQLNCFYFGKLK